MTPASLHAETLAQIDALPLDPHRPLLVSDADEVLLRFVEGLERFLALSEMRLDLRTYALHGNVRHRSGEPVAHDEVTAILKRFYAEAHHELDAVEEAAAALRRLSARLQIVVLTNVPQASAAARAANLARHGMHYPVVANSGLKGPAIRAIGGRVRAPLFFVDDIPHNLASAAELHPDSQRIHFVADSRLRPLLGPCAHADHHAESWPAIADWIEARLGA